MTATAQHRTLEARIRALGPWFHNLDLDGIETAPHHFLGNHPQQKWQRFQHLVPEDLSGRSVLDIGCNAGFFALELKRRGAGTVVAIDSDLRYLAQAELAAEITGLEIDLRQLSVYDVAALGRRFDLVLFMGVLYHLRHPLLALDLLHEHAVGDLMLFQTLLRGSDTVAPVPDDLGFDETATFDQPGYPRLHFVETCYADDPTNWWIPNRACAEAMLRSAGYRIDAHVPSDVWLCRRAPRPAMVEPPPVPAP